MSRWSEKLGNSVHFAIEEIPEETFLESFFENRAFIPENEEERKEFEDFSFVSSALALAVYTALADGEVSEKEEEQIVKEIMIQIQQHYYEYEELAAGFGSSDEKIVTSLYDIYKKEILTKVFDLQKTIALINKFYGKNPYKKFYLIRLCYLVAFTDSLNNNQELNRVTELARQLHVDVEEKDRIRNEVMAKLKK